MLVSAVQKQKRNTMLVRPEFLETLSRTLKVTQVLAFAFALAQLTVVLAVA
jgi:hypothetical protein